MLGLVVAERAVAMAALDDHAALTSAAPSLSGDAAFASSLRAFLASDALARAGLVARPDRHGGTGLFAARDLAQGFELTIPTRWVLDSRSGKKLGFPWVLCERSQELTTFTPPSLFI